MVTPLGVSLSIAFRTSDTMAHVSRYSTGVDVSSLMSGTSSVPRKERRAIRGGVRGPRGHNPITGDTCKIDWRRVKLRNSLRLGEDMTVQITLKSTQHTGMATSTEGSVAAWQVTFELDGDESLHAAIHIRLAGPPTHHEARQKALKILQVFLTDACEAAKKYQFSN
jgi:hypothetical protein